MTGRFVAWTACLVLVGLLGTGCSLSKRTVDPGAWRTNTVRLVNQSSMAGPYAEASSGIVGDATPYTTFYALRTYQVLGTEYPVDHRERTAKWIRSLADKNGSMTSSRQSGDEMGEIFYGLTIMANLGVAAPGKEAFAATVHRLQFDSGPYAFSTKHKESLQKAPDAGESLLATYEALRILDLLGEAPHRRPELIRWVQGQWDLIAGSIGKGEATTSSLNLLAASLQMLAPSDPRLSDAWGVIRKSIDVELADPDRYRELLLIDVAAAVEAAERFRVSPDWLPTWFVDDLGRKQNRDGGFNAFLNGDSDYVGTYLAASVLRYAGRDGIHGQPISKLIELHRAPNGGYYTMASRPVSLSATRGVAQAAAFLQVPLDKPALEKYLSGVLKEASTPEDVHLALDTARLAGIRMPSTPSLIARLEQWAQLEAPLGSMEDLERLYHTAAALHLLNADIRASLRESVRTNLEALHNQDGGYGPDGKSTLEVTGRVAVILHWIGAKAEDRDGLVRWIQKRQKQGFADTGNPANLAATYLALQALAAYGSQPSDPDAVRQWLVACLRPEGGATFAPPGASGTPESADGLLMWTGLTIRSLELTGVDAVDDAALRKWSR